jgi:hypothetical protein
MLYRYENWKYPEIMKCTFVFEEKKRRILGTNLYEIFYERTRKMLPFNTGDYCSINKWADIL